MNATEILKHLATQEKDVCKGCVEQQAANQVLRNIIMYVQGLCQQLHKDNRWLIVVIVVLVVLGLLLWLIVVIHVLLPAPLAHYEYTPLGVGGPHPTQPYL